MPSTAPDRTPYASGPDLTLHGGRPFEPPYDDEPGGSAGELIEGSLALALPLTRSEAAPPALRLLAGGRTEDQVRTEVIPQPRRRPRTAKEAASPATDPESDLEEEPAFAGARTPRRALPPPRVFGARLVQALSEAAAGERPLSQLSPHLSRPVYHRLERHFASTLRGTGAHAGPDNRANVRSVHVCEPSDGVAELSAVVRRGTRMAAIALRLEGRDGRWQCTALQIG